MDTALKILTALLAGAGQFIGIRSTAGEPPYAIVEKTGDIEIRRYEARIVAETEAAGTEEEARGTGFRRIAAYIFGANKTRSSIAMTAPVAQTSVNIAMTAPAAQGQSADRRWKIQFFMPASYTMETLPVPKDPMVHLATEPAALYAVLRFSGSWSAAAIDEKEAYLLKQLQSSKWRANSAPVAWFYDPPWTIPALRRNEVAVAVTVP